MISLEPPEERTCTRCGRTDVWSQEAETWTASVADGETLTGTPHCLHEWDINGSYNPIREDS